MSEAISAGLAALDLPVSRAEAAQLDAYLELLARWNRVHNLTGIKSREVMTRRHLAESLALRSALRGGRIADVGSGAGLPGIPLAIVAPEREFMLIESRAKRAAFLRHVKGALALDNVEVAESRVEHLRDAGPFDTVLARAVAPLPELVGLTAHLLGANGVLLVPTKAEFAAEAGRVDATFRVEPIEPAAQDVLRGALVRIQRTDNQGVE
jgi:16S rRNA (guanine527-N7)-methyltransferase